VYRVLAFIALLPIAGFFYFGSPFPRIGATGAELVRDNVEAQNDNSGPDDSTLPDRESATVRVYLFLSLDCPISNYYLHELNQLHEEFAPEGVQLIGLVSGLVSTPEEIEQHQKEFAVRFPLLCDRNNELSRQWGATHTPQAIVVDEHNRLVYSGRIDDLYADIGRKRLKPSQYDLKNVLMAMTLDEPVPVRHTQPIGCPIPQAVNGSSDEVTYHGAIAALFYRACAECHRPGQVAPFSLLSYEDARSHAAQIRLAVEKNLMPPWKAAKGYGHFKNERFLTASERQLIYAWIDGGMPEGNPDVGPSPPEYQSDWQLGAPDLILTMPEAFEVPAGGPDIYQHFVIPTGLLQDRLVRAVEFQPGAVEVVHHAGLFLDPDGHARKLDAEDPAPGYSSLGVPGFPTRGSLGSWGPGRLPNPLPDGMGRPLWKNSDLVMQIHYHPTGRAMKDVSRVGIYFAPPEANQFVCEIIVADVDLTIPAGADDHIHRAEYVLPVDTTLLNTNPHMHLLGKSAKCYAVLPDGTEQPLIHIPQWDFYWQTEYVYEKPVRLPAGTKLVLECSFDNSKGNPLNFNDPPQTVYWGDYSTDEMAICYFRVTADTVEDVNKLYWDCSETFGLLWERYQQNKKRQQNNEDQEGK